MKKLFAKNSWLLTIVILFQLAAFSPIVARAQDGSLDISFNPGSGTHGDVLTAALQPDGKIVIGGGFDNVNEIPRKGIARLNADGSLDASFNPGTGVTGFNEIVYTVALQPDGKVLIGGAFTVVNGVSHICIARLNANGSLDASFNPIANGTVRTMSLQPDGKMIIGGEFNTVNNVQRRGIARLNADGSLDTSFNPGIGIANPVVNSLALQPDGKIVISGTFLVIEDISRNRIARLNANGSLDNSFNPGSGVDGPVYKVALQPDGKFLIGGAFINVNGVPRNSLARLDANGSLDTSFNQGIGPSDSIRAITLQPDGKVLIGGSFDAFDGAPRFGIARLNANGSIDDSFEPGIGTATTNVIFTILLQPDGKVIVGGFFNTFVTTVASNIARLLNTIPQSLTINNVTLNEGNSGTTAFNFTVNLSAATTQTVMVNYQTANGTAVSPSDYQAASGSLSFAPGETSKTVTVLINGDTAVEPNETFTVNLSGATNATITGGIGTGTIVNDDTCAYSISPTSLNIGASGGAGNTISVTAQAGCAYTATSNNSFITINSGASGSGNGTVVFTVAANAGAARTGTIIVAGQTFTVIQAASPTFRKTPFDFDGDGKADISIYRPNAGLWYLLNSTAGFGTTQWGISTDKIVPADYDGDGKTNIAVYRPSNGMWYILNADNSYYSIQWGLPTDIPVPGDYDGDGKTNIAVYRPSNGIWYILNADGSYYGIQWGVATDKIVPADYDGDGKTNIAVYRPSNGLWYILNADNSYYGIQFGVAIDIPVPADYDGDGKADTAVFRPTTGTWYLLQTTAGFAATQWGGLSDKPVAADYDGDGKADIGIFRPSNGKWYLLQTTAGYTAVQWGFSTDIPIPATN